jgi:23S rRNA pseudouridine1911/1915/1917 synthase
MLTHPHENHIIPEDIPLNIVYEIGVLLLINKEPGMVVHQVTEIYRTCSALAHHFENLPMNSSERPGFGTSY